MGTWGPGVYENDYALDLQSEEVGRLSRQLEEAMSAPRAAFDDIEGPLVYVRVLSLLAQDAALEVLDRKRVEGWKKRYLDIFNSTIEAGELYVAKRRDVITREFDTLLARLRE